MEGNEESVGALPGGAGEAGARATGRRPGTGGAREAAPPPMVPGWTVGRRLGAGADAEVWEVRGAAGERAALKVPLPGGAEGLVQEAAALRHHRHRHLVAPLGEVETDRGTGLLTELLAGGSLAALVRAGGPLPAARMRTAVVPIAQALESLHAEGIVHGDVSPSNILFDVDGRPALSDLGASRLLGGCARGGGTPGFAAPESAVDDPDTAGAAGDVFSLAAVAWFCLTGRAPAALQDRAPLPVLVPEADAELGDLLDAALDPEPERRPGAAEFAHALYATGDCEPVLLHASASPEVALVLPTVRPERPEGSGRTGGGRGGRRGRARDRRGRARGNGGGRGRARGRGGGRGTVRWRRPLVPGAARVRTGAVVGAGVLAAAALSALLLLPGDDGGAAPTAAPPPAPAPGMQEPAGRDPDASAPGPPAEVRVPRTPDGSEEEGSPDDGAESGGGTARVPDAPVLDRIAVERAGALLGADAEAVEDYTVAGSEAAEEDRAVIEALHAQGSRFEDLRIELHQDGEPIGVAGPESTVVAVPVVLETSAHRVLDGGGWLLAEEPARSDSATLVMERTGTRWKVSEVRAR